MRTTRTSTRRIAALGAAVGLAASALAAASTPAQAAGTRGHGARAGAVATAGFRPVRTSAGQVLSMTAPAAGEVWVLEKDAAGMVVLEHLSGGRWTTSRPGVNAGWSPQISGTAANDVWYEAGGSLFHWDGRRWSVVSTPGGLQAVAVTDVPGGDAYVGLTGEKASAAGLYRVSGNGARWTSLGRPADEENDHSPTWTVQSIAAVRNRVFAGWHKLPHSATNTIEGFGSGPAGWTDLGIGTFAGGGSYVTPAAWLAPNPALTLLLGRFDYGSSQGGVCQVWVQGSGATTCTTRWAVGAAALRSDGKVVVGGNDYRPRYDGPVTQGTFGLRDEYGRESVVPGDPGDATVAMAVEPGTDVAWAATTTNGVTSLQSSRP